MTQKVSLNPNAIGTLVESQACNDSNFTMKQDGRVLNKTEKASLYNQIGDAVYFNNFESNLETFNHTTEIANSKNFYLTKGFKVNDNLSLVTGVGFNGVSKIKKNNGIYNSVPIVANVATDSQIYNIENDGADRMYAMGWGGSDSRGILYHNIFENKGNIELANCLIQKSSNSDFNKPIIGSISTYSSYNSDSDTENNITAFIVQSANKDDFGFLIESNIKFFDKGVERMCNPNLFRDISQNTVAPLWMSARYITCIKYDQKYTKKWYVTTAFQFNGTTTGTAVIFEINSLYDSAPSRVYSFNTTSLAPINFILPTANKILLGLNEAATSTNGLVVLPKDFSTFTRPALPTAMKVTGGYEFANGSVVLWGNSGVNLGVGNSLLIRTPDTTAASPAFSKISTTFETSAGGGFNAQNPAILPNGDIMITSRVIVFPSPTNEKKFAIKITDAGSVTDYALDTKNGNNTILINSAAAPFCYGIAYNATLNKVCAILTSSSIPKPSVSGQQSNNAEPFVLELDYTQITAGTRFFNILYRRSFMWSNGIVPSCIKSYKNLFIVMMQNGTQFNVIFDNSIGYLYNSAINNTSAYFTGDSDNNGNAYIGSRDGVVYKALDEYRLAPIYVNTPFGGQNFQSPLMKISYITNINQFACVYRNQQIIFVNQSNNVVTTITKSQLTNNNTITLAPNTMFVDVVADNNEVIILTINNAGTMSLLRALNTGDPTTLNFIQQKYILSSSYTFDLDTLNLQHYTLFMHGGYCYIITNFAYPFTTFHSVVQPNIIRFDTKTILNADSTNTATKINVYGLRDEFLKSSPSITFVNYKIFKNADINAGDIVVITNTDTNYAIVGNLKTLKFKFCKVANARSLNLVSLNDTNAYLIDSLSGTFKEVSLDFDTSTQFQLSYDLKKDIIV